MTSPLDADGWQRLKRDFSRLADLTPETRDAVDALRGDPRLADMLRRMRLD